MENFDENEPLGTEGYLLTPEQAEEFFRRAEFNEALTQKERNEILREMAAEGKIQAHFITSQSKDEVIDNLKNTFRLWDITEGKRKKIEGDDNSVDDAPEAA